MNNYEITLAEPVAISDSSGAKLFTPNMVLIATVLGGLLGGGALIWANYKAINNLSGANKTLIWCLSGTLLLFAISAFITSSVGTGIAIGCAVGLKAFAQKEQWKPESLKKSWWLALLVGLISLAVTLVSIVIFSLAFSMILPQNG